MVLGFLLGISGCATPQSTLWPPVPGERTKDIYVSIDTWHAMIGFSIRDLSSLEQGNGDRPFSREATKRPAFQEWGYAERAWYLEGHTGISGAFRALLWPTAAIVEVGEHDQLWSKRTPDPPADLFTFSISIDGYHRLRRYLDSTLVSREPITSMNGSRFYPAVHSYHLLYHCHHYVAEALQKAGLPVSRYRAFNRSSLVAQLQHLSDMIKTEGMR